MSWRTWNGPKAAAKMAEVNRLAVQDACLTILAGSKAEVPLDEGTLMRSGRVFMAPEPEASGIVSYGGGPGTGGPLIPYALKVHETDRKYQHGRKWHYLRDPFNKLGKAALSAAIAVRSKDFK